MPEKISFLENTKQTATLEYIFLNNIENNKKNIFIFRRVNFKMCLHCLYIFTQRHINETTNFKKQIVSSEMEVLINETSETTNATELYETKGNPSKSLSNTTTMFYIFALSAVALLSQASAYLICAYIKTKPVGKKRLVDLIYSDFTR